MNREERIRNAIKPFLPPGTEHRLAKQIVDHRCHLTITRERKTKAGDYRHPYGNQGHRISVNGTLNPYAFLITLVHEMAHLVTWEQNRNSVKPHGKEWKDAFKLEMQPYLTEDVFPKDVLSELKRHMRSPLSATSRDLNLIRVLKSYDEPNAQVFLEDVPFNSEFTLGNKRFVKGEQLRKRFRCTEIGTGRVYLVSSIAEVLTD